MKRKLVVLFLSFIFIATSFANGIYSGDIQFSANYANAFISKEYTDNGTKRLKDLKHVFLTNKFYLGLSVNW